MSAQFTPDQFLGLVNDLLRTMPQRPTLRSMPEGSAWLGRARAVIGRTDAINMARLDTAIMQLENSGMTTSSQGYHGIMTLLYQLQQEFLLQISGPNSVAIPLGKVFEYFDELRKLTEQAVQDVLFVDPYLDADFVSTYLPHVKAGVTIRLLTTEKKLATLLPAVSAFNKQYGSNVAVRTTGTLHDRFLFIDRQACHQSGASFKDGARNAATVLSQITDAFLVMQKTYEDLWSSGVVRS